MASENEEVAAPPTFHFQISCVIFS